VCGFSRKIIGYSPVDYLITDLDLFYFRAFTVKTTNAPIDLYEKDINSIEL